jgi:hypothetical protein
MLMASTAHDGRQTDAGTEAEFPDRFQFEISREDYSNGVEVAHV